VNDAIQFAMLRGMLPRGGRLPLATWRNRHRGIVRLLWLHVALIPAYGLMRGYAFHHLVLEASVIVAAALVASSEKVSRPVRTVVASLGLLACSGILVHLSGGVIEMHFHFFVMVAVVSLYQDWAPFLTAIGFVFVQHGLFGALDAHSVFNHGDAIAHPWRWAGIHAAFIAFESVACLVNWRLNESLYDSEHAARMTSEIARTDLSLLVAATGVLTSSFDLEVMMEGLVALATSAVADGCAVDIIDESGGLSRVACSGPEPSALSPDRLERIRRGEVLSIADEQGPLVVVPVIGGAEVLGALSLWNEPGRRPLEDSVVPVATELGRRAGIAVENARLYERQRSVALTLQQALLPERLPEIPGLESAARYLAGGPGVEVGGDWYDLIPLSRGRLLLVMGDIVGRGEKAAALMGQLRSYLRGHTLVETEPSALLTHLNRLLHEANQSDMATLVCGLLDPAASLLTIANAGHPPVALRDPDGAVTWLTGATGPPLGALARATYGQEQVELQPGSTLLLYTDGVVEDRETSIDVGLGRLEAALAEAPQDADALCEHVLTALLSEHRSSDDAALLAVKLLPLEDKLSLELPCDVASLEPMRATLGRWLDHAGATPTEAYEILVATCEAAANAIVHASGPLHSPIYLEATLDGQLHVTVSDSGTWRRPVAGTGGRGLSIMESFMDDVHIDSGEGGTRVHMRRQLAAPPARAGA
jgi:anti-sigma regulatory factor (Ser/Thr protein kinase)